LSTQYTAGANVNLVQYVNAFESYRLTDRQTDRQTESTEIINHADSRMVNNTAVVLFMADLKNVLVWTDQAWLQQSPPHT